MPSRANVTVPVATPTIVTIGMIMTGATTFVAPPPVVASDLRAPYTRYTLGLDAPQTMDGMTDNAALETAIRDLAGEVKKLREDGGKKSPAELVAMWGPAVAMLAAVIAIVNVSGRVGDLEKKVDAGFQRLTEAVSKLDVRESVTEATSKPAPAMITPSGQK